MGKQENKPMPSISLTVEIKDGVHKHQWGGKDDRWLRTLLLASLLCQREISELLPDAIKMLELVRSLPKTKVVVSELFKN